MVRLRSNHERRTQHRTHCRPDRRSHPRGSAYGAYRALTATELAIAADVTKQTISTHLAKLLEAKLIAVESQGRHRYFRLANPDVAHLLETLMGVAFRTGAIRTRSSPREPALRRARICYDHLAGEFGVTAYESLVAKNVFRQKSGALSLTPTGADWFISFGVDIQVASLSRRIFCRSCLDWSERRSHLAGSLGAALLNRIYELKWASQAKNSRVIHFTAEGEQAFLALFK